MLPRFLEEAKAHLTPNGVIVMPFYHLAGDGNSPAVQGPWHGYLVEEKARIQNKQGLQQGEISIYELRRPRDP